MTENQHCQNRIELTLICGLFVMSLLLRLAILAPTQFDGLYGQDAYAYYDYAQDLRTSLQSGTVLKPFFWPLGYPALLATGLSIGSTRPTVAQAISILMGAALTPLVYLIARQIGISRIGSLTAATLMTFCGQALQSSMVVMSDIPSLFWATLSGLFLIRYLIPYFSSPTNEVPYQTKWLVVAASALALATLSRWIFLILALPFAITILISWRGRIHWHAAALTLVVTGLIFLPQLLFTRANPSPTVEHEWVQGWSPANAFQRSFVLNEGHHNFEKVNALFYAQPFYDPYYLSPLFSVFIIIGLWALKWRGLWLLILFGGWTLLPYLFLAGTPYQNIRYPLIVVPAVAVLVGSGMQAVISGLSQTQIRRYKLLYVQWLIVPILLIGLWQMWGRANEVITIFITNQQRDKLAAAWADDQIPTGATVYTFGLTLTLKHYTTLDVYELYYETPETLAQKWQRGRKEYLLLNVWNIENQWVDRIPQFDYHWLRDQRGLDQIGKHGNYTLFRIRG